MDGIVKSWLELLGRGYKHAWRFKGRYLIIRGSRRSKKSTTIAFKAVKHIMEHGKNNVLVVRKTYRSLKDSCFSQLRWAINQMGVHEYWHITQSPLEMTYIPTGQKIMFRGADDPLKITSITPAVGALTMLWIEEAFEIESEEDFDKIDNSMMGGILEDGQYRQTVLTFNPWHDMTWIKHRFFDNQNGEQLIENNNDGILYSSFIEADNGDNTSIETMVYRTDYRCNEWLSSTDLAEFDLMKQTDPQRYNVAGLGHWGTVGDTIFNANVIADRIRIASTPIDTGTYVYKSNYEENKRKILVEDNSIKFISENTGYIKIYKQPETNRRYVIGGDTAGEGSDYFAAHVIDSVTKEQVAVLHGYMDSDIYAYQIYCLGKSYNYAHVAIESNFDLYPIRVLDDLGYHNQFLRKKEDRLSHNTQLSYGFRTGKDTRPLIISKLVEFARDNIDCINDKDTLREMATFVRNERGRAEAALGSHDDLVISLAIALYANDSTPNKPVTKFVWTEEKREDYAEASPREKIRLRREWGLSD